ncbi:MAG: hypothetical protein KDD60_00610 [Bdellovibrionales bacterium]|nr:hypothetical protein [Bdellovibrionales bacterium]
MNATTQYKWLEKNHDNVEWRLVGPNFRNRFDSSVSESRLEEYVRDRELLWENCSAQCFLDDACIIRITDMTFFEYETNHPNLIGIEQEDVRRYLETQGVIEEMRKELDKMLDLCARELEARRNGLESPLD